MLFLFIFVVIPMLEITVFITVGQYIGVGYTLLLALLTAIIGGAIVRYQGLQTLFSLRTTLNAGQLPVQDVLEGVFLVAAGAMLITPGFVTDTAGFLLLVPRVRRLVIKMAAAHFQIYTTGPDWQEREDPEILEAEYKKVDEQENN